MFFVSAVDDADVCTVRKNREVFSLVVVTVGCACRALGDNLGSGETDKLKAIKI
jgi:hypothetical protein